MKTPGIEGKWKKEINYLPQGVWAPASLPNYGGSLDPDPEILIHAQFGLAATFFFQKLSIYLEIGAFAFCNFFMDL